VLLDFYTGMMLHTSSYRYLWSIMCFGVVGLCVAFMLCVYKMHMCARDDLDSGKTTSCVYEALCFHPM